MLGILENLNIEFVFSVPLLHLLLFIPLFTRNAFKLILHDVENNLQIHCGVEFFLTVNFKVS